MTRTQLTSAATLAFGAALVFSIGIGPAAARAADPAVAWLVAAPGGCGSPTYPGPSSSYGVVSLGRLDASTAVTVQILRGVPNERYTVNISCVGSIGDIYTNAKGRGSARIPISQTLPFAIDVHLYCDPSVSGDCSARWGESARTSQLVSPP
jgi:hypothetical protein